MKRYSTREAAKNLGLSHAALARYVLQGKIPAPETIQQGKRLSHSWSVEDIENIRKLLPRIANGRKTRYQKLREKQKTPPRAAVPHEKGQTKKKKKTR